MKKEQTNKKKEICCLKNILKKCMQNMQGLKAVSEYVKISREYNGTEQVQAD